ncbi:unnamed protein product [Moneuplotes crassus]|uniref:Uncharacterized protein n=1 Tax=Euplotes crassus TaxID=5936 RepID=A0AAD1Y3S7_EUPCR|nr:unnamed protein product [Moneuplotes crassus]
MMIQMLNERVKGQVEHSPEDAYKKLNQNPIFKNLGIAIRDCNENSIQISPKNKRKIDNRINQPSGNSLGTPKNSDRFRCGGFSYDSDIPLSTKYPSINFNKFGYLYNFSKQRGQEQAEKRKNLTEKVSVESLYEEPDIPNIQQIIKNPCIFSIRDKLMTRKLSDTHRPPLTTSQQTSKELVRMKCEQRHRKNLSLQIEPVQKGIKNILIDRNSKFPEKIPAKVKSTYLHNLMDDKSFCPKLVHNGGRPQDKDGFEESIRGQEKAGVSGSTFLCSELCKY